MDITARRKLYLNALKGRSNIYDLIGECDKAIKDNSRAIKFIGKEDFSDASHLMSFRIERARLMVHRKSDYTTGEKIITELLLSMKKKENPELYGKTCSQKAAILLKRSKYDEALEYLKIVLDIQKELCDIEERCVALNRIGEVYQTRGNFQKALQFYQQGLELAEKEGYKRGIEISCNNIGTLNRTRGNYDVALKFYNRYLKIAKETGNKVGMGIVSSNMGNVFNAKGEPDKALHYFNIDLSIAQQIGDKRGIAIASNNIGNAFAYKKDFANALRYFKKYLSLSLKMGYERGVGIASYNIAGIYTDTKKYDDAEYYFRRAEKVLLKTGDRLALISVYINLSEMNERQGKYVGAIHAAQEAMDLSKNIGAEIHRVYSLRAMGRALALRDLQKARPYLERALARAKEGGLPREVALLESDLAELMGDVERGDRTPGFDQ